MYWIGNLVTGAPPWRARHRPVASFRVHCPVCGTDCVRGACDHAASFVADVPTEEVADAALDLLSGAATCASAPRVD